MYVEGDFGYTCIDKPSFSGGPMPSAMSGSGPRIGGHEHSNSGITVALDINSLRMNPDRRLERDGQLGWVVESIRRDPNHSDRCLEEVMQALGFHAVLGDVARSRCRGCLSGGP